MQQRTRDGCQQKIKCVCGVIYCGNLLLDSLSSARGDVIEAVRKVDQLLLRSALNVDAGLITLRFHSATGKYAEVLPLTGAM